MELLDLGFVEAGEWKLRAGTRSGIMFELNKLQNERVIYAFVVSQESKYVGVCEKGTTTLEQRMARYKNLQGEGANERIARKIKECLDAGKIARIMAMKPEQSLQYRGVTVDLVRGLENPLIEKLKPPWNIRK